MFDFWFFVPKSGVAYIFASVIAIVIWNQYRATLAHPYHWIFAIEIILFIICFLIAHKESEGKIQK